jgi:uncharacterized protein YbaR (Trm112 family)
VCGTPRAVWVLCTSFHPLWVYYQRKQWRRSVTVDQLWPRSHFPPKLDLVRRPNHARVRGRLVCGTPRAVWVLCTSFHPVWAMYYQRKQWRRSVIVYQLWPRPQFPPKLDLVRRSNHARVRGRLVCRTPGAVWVLCTSFHPLWVYYQRKQWRRSVIVDQYMWSRPQFPPKLDLVRRSNHARVRGRLVCRTPGAVWVLCTSFHPVWVYYQRK